MDRGDTGQGKREFVILLTAHIPTCLLLLSRAAAAAGNGNSHQVTIWIPRSRRSAAVVVLAGGAWLLQLQQHAGQSVQWYGRGAEGGISDVGRRTVQKSRRPTDTRYECAEERVFCCKLVAIRSWPYGRSAHCLLVFFGSVCLPGYCCVTM